VERGAAKTIVVYLHQHVGEFGGSDANQVTNPPSVGAQTHGKVSGAGSQQPVHFPPIGHRVRERLEAAILQVLQGFLALLLTQLRVERCVQFLFDAATIVAKVSPGMGAETTQRCIEGFVELEPMLPRQAAGFYVQIRPDRFQGSIGLFRTLTKRLPRRRAPWSEQRAAGLRFVEATRGLVPGQLRCSRQSDGRSLADIRLGYRQPFSRGDTLRLPGVLWSGPEVTPADCGEEPHTAQEEIQTEARIVTLPNALAQFFHFRPYPLHRPSATQDLHRVF
jgi:hypothetical protein